METLKFNVKGSTFDKVKTDFEKSFTNSPSGNSILKEAAN